MITRRTFVAAAGAFGLAPAVPAAAASPRRIRMFELYGEDDEFSPLARELAGQRVSLQGFMAPHLRVDADFFILSNTPVETCPFCASEGDWIDSIVFVRMRRKEEAVSPGVLIVAEGTLEIGPARDEATGFVSKVRLVDAAFRTAGR